MIRFLADENFNGKIVRGVQRKYPDADIVRIQDTAMAHTSDPKVLEWAAQEKRIVLSHDVRTMVGYANQRVTQGLPMPGLIIASDSLPVGQVVNDLVVIIAASDMNDWDNLVAYLPL